MICKVSEKKQSKDNIFSTIVSKIEKNSNVTEITLANDKDETKTAEIVRQLTLAKIESYGAGIIQQKTEKRSILLFS